MTTHAEKKKMMANVLGIEGLTAQVSPRNTARTLSKLYGLRRLRVQQYK